MPAGVYVITPKGELLGRIPIPEDLCTNLAFGGPLTERRSTSRRARRSSRSRWPSRATPLPASVAVSCANELRGSYRDSPALRAGMTQGTTNE